MLVEGFQILKKEKNYMDIGSIIKELRIKKGITQEQLAEMLNVSSQAISRWETSVTYPDILLLPIISNIFEVTTDYLLGVDIYKKQNQIEGYYKQIFDLQRKGNIEELITLCRKAVKEFPNEYELKISLVSALQNYVIGCTNDTEIQKKYREECVDICETVLKNSMDDKVRQEAILFLSYIYPELDRKKDAIRLAKQMPKWFCSEDFLLEGILDGTEKEKKLQDNILIGIDVIYKNMVTLAYKYAPNEALMVYFKCLEFFNLIFEEKIISFYIRHQYALYEYIAREYCNLGDVKNALKYVNLSVEGVIKYSNRATIEKYNLIYLNHIIEDKTQVTKNNPETEYSWVKKFYSQDTFDLIREDKLFIELMEKLNSLDN